MCGVYCFCFCGHICRLGNPIKIISVVFIIVLFMDYLLLYICRESEIDDCKYLSSFKWLKKG